MRGRSCKSQKQKRVELCEVQEINVSILESRRVDEAQDNGVLLALALAGLAALDALPAQTYCVSGLSSTPPRQVGRQVLDIHGTNEQKELGSVGTRFK